MRIAHLNTNKIPAGATMSALRLHKALLQKGQSSLFIAESDRIASNDADLPGSFPITRLRSKLDRTISTLLGGSSQFVLNQVISGYVPTLNALDVDVFNLHIMRGGFLSSGEISSLEKPVVWSVHDMWPITAGCTYSGGCAGYSLQCGKCPVNQSTRENDLSRMRFKLRQEQWRNFRPTFVAPSKWMAKCIEKSAILRGMRVEVIPYGLDETIWRPVDRKVGRRYFGLPENKRIVLFGAVGGVADRRKGADLLFDAMHHPQIQGSNTDTVAVVFGGKTTATSKFGNIKVYEVGHISDELILRNLYASADIFVAPSREDNLPNTVLESIACGTPVVCYKIGGMPDMIEHLKNGYLAEPFSVEDLSAGIRWALAPDNNARARANATKVFLEKFRASTQASRYIELYSELAMKAPSAKII